MFRPVGSSRLRKNIISVTSCALLAGLVSCTDPPAPVSQIMLSVRPFIGGSTGDPMWLAVQSDMRGSWRRLSGNNGVYPITITDRDGRYGIAIVCEGGGPPQVKLFYATTTEVASPKLNCGFRPEQPTLFTISGITTGFKTPASTSTSLLSGEYISTYLSGTANRTIIPIFAQDRNLPYQLSTSAGAQRLVAVRTQMPVAGASAGTTDRVIMRNFTINDNLELDLDFSQAQATEAHTVNVTLPGVILGGYVGFHHPNNRSATFDPLLGQDALQPTNPRWTYGGIPTALQTPEDIHAIYLEDTQTSGPHVRHIQRYFKTPQDVTLSLPAQLSTASTVVLSRNPSVRLRTTWPTYTSAQWYQVSFTPIEPTSGHWSATLSSGFFGTSGPRVETPNFAGLEGWQSQWDMHTQGTIPVLVSAQSSNRSTQEALNIVDANFPGTLADGFEIKMADYFEIINVR